MCRVQRSFSCLVYLFLFFMRTVLEMKEKVQWPWYGKSLLEKFNSKEIATIMTDFHRKSLPRGKTSLVLTPK